MGGLSRDDPLHAAVRQLPDLAPTTHEKARHPQPFTDWPGGLLSDGNLRQFYATNILITLVAQNSESDYSPAKQQKLQELVS
ncbi:hypothetical protein D9M70_519730 [compost metagenome]